MINIFSEIINMLVEMPNVHFASQQRGEMDLTIEEKRRLAEKLLKDNPNNFLVRFGPNLNTDQLNRFYQYCDDSENGFIIKSTLEGLLSQKDIVKLSEQTRNRRYNALQELINNGNYFSELEMMKRAPMLYNDLVGQYLTPEERQERNQAAPQDTLVKILMEGIELNEAKELQKQQESIEECTLEEEDTSDSDEEDNDSKCSSENIKQDKPSTSKGYWGESEEIVDERIKRDEFYSNDEKTIVISSKQRKLFQEEFLSIMYQNFLEGRDEFDYTQVDNNETYDNLEILTQDAEDNYFDTEDPNTIDTEMNGVSSEEDELDVFMNKLENQHSIVKQIE